MTSLSSFRTGRQDTPNQGDCLYRGTPQRMPSSAAFTSCEAAAEAMYEDGFVQFPDLLSHEEMHILRGWMDSILQPRPPVGAQSDQVAAAATLAPLRKAAIDLQHDPMWLRLIDRDPVFDTLELILGKNFVCTGGSLSITEAADATAIHVDRLPIALPEELLRDDRVRLPIYTCTLEYYLEDQTEAIGPTLVIPGSHRAGRVPYDEATWNGVSPKSISTRAGGGLLFRHDLWHGTSGSEVGKSRYVIRINYGERSWKTAGPPITQADSFSPEVTTRVTARQRVLMGQVSKGIFL